MSTYLVALFVGEMDLLEDSVDGIRLGIHTVKGKRERARYAMEATKQIVRYFNAYFGEPYPLVKLDQLALPGGISGAMKTGGDRYNEGRFLYSPGKFSAPAASGLRHHRARDRAPWFANLVTMAWWEQLVAERGLRLVMAARPRSASTRAGACRCAMRFGKSRPCQRTRADDPSDPDAGRERHARDGRLRFHHLRERSCGSAHARGLSRRRRFPRGVQGYMRAHRFSNTTTADFWHHLSGASGQDIGKLVAGWTEQPGYRW